MNDIIIFVPFTEMNAFALILASSKFTHVHFLPQSRGLSTLLFMSFIHASFHFFYHNPIYFPSFDPLVNDGKNCRATLIIEQDLTRVRDLEIKLANLVDITCLFRPFFVQLVREIPRVAEAINFIRGPEVLLLLIFRISYSGRKWSIAFFLRLQITYLMLIWPWKEREGGREPEASTSKHVFLELNRASFTVGHCFFASTPSPNPSDRWPSMCTQNGPHVAQPILIFRVDSVTPLSRVYASAAEDRAIPVFGQPAGHTLLRRTTWRHTLWLAQ